MAEEEFINTIRANHHGRLMRRKLRGLHYAVRNSIGIEAGTQSVSTEISLLVEKLRLIDRHVRRIEIGSQEETGWESAHRCSSGDKEIGCRSH
jgi:hypothetical protein